MEGAYDEGYQAGFAEAQRQVAALQPQPAQQFIPQPGQSLMSMIEGKEGLLRRIVARRTATLPTPALPTATLPTQTFQPFQPQPFQPFQPQPFQPANTFQGAFTPTQFR
jgi:hypothetical protein